MKDKFKQHYQEFKTDNITVQDLQVAEDAYLQFGAGDDKNKSVLRANTLFDRAATYHQLKLGSLRKSMDDVLLSMCRTYHQLLGSFHTQVRAWTKHVLILLGA